MYSSGFPTHNTMREHTFLHIAENANVQILHIVKNVNVQFLHIVKNVNVQFLHILY